MTRYCGDCRHYQLRENYGMGVCCPPVPYWMMGNSVNTPIFVLPTSRMAEECACFYPREEATK